MTNASLKKALAGASLFVLASVAVAQPAVYTDLGNVVAPGTSISEVHAAGDVKWYRFNLTTSLTPLQRLKIDTEGTVNFLSGNDTEIGLYANDGTLLANDDDSGTGLLSLITASGLSAGTYWVAASGFNANFNPLWDVTTNSTRVGDLIVNFSFDEIFPPTATDLGVIGSPGREVSSFVNPAEVVWYKFETTAEVDLSRFFTMHTRNTTTFLGGTFGPNDTEIGLFGAGGNLIATNDDEDFATGILTSFLTYGSTSTTGATLPAGNYYLAVGGFNTTFGGSFTATSTSTASGDIVLTFETDLPGGGGTAISGTCDLTDFGPDEAGRSAAWELLDSNGAVVESGTTALGAGGAYTVNVNAASGTYTFTMKASHWLKGGVENIVAGAPATANFALVNGDVDNDNEVGPGDFGALATAFLSVDGDPNWNAEADLDGDGEVGPGDFGILANNFLQAGYGA